MTSIEEMGNPFIRESAELHAVYDSYILQNKMVRTTRNNETLDEKLHSEYVEERMVYTTTPISHPLSK